MEADFQKGYMDILAMPLFNSFAQVFPGAAKLIDQAEQIMKFWEAINDMPSGSSSYTILLSSSLEELKAGLVSQTNDRYETLAGTTMTGDLPMDDDEY